MGLLRRRAHSGPLDCFAMLAMTLVFFRHCEEGEDRRGNPWAATGARSSAVLVAGSHGFLPATGAPSRLKVIALAMTLNFVRHCEEALADAACRERGRTVIQNRPSG